MRHYNQKEKRTTPLSARDPCRMRWLYVMQSCRCSLRAVCALRGRISDSFFFLGLVCEYYVICRVVEGNGAKSGKWWNGTSSRIPRLGIVDECGVMIKRVVKWEWLIWRELMVNRVWKKEERRGTTAKREWCLGMRERKKRNSSCERSSSPWKHSPC